MTKQAVSTRIQAPKVMIVCVQAPYHHTKDKDMDSYFQEFRNLVKTSRGSYDAEYIIKLRLISAALFITKGKAEELKVLCEQNGIQEVIFSEQLSPQQERNLADFLDTKVIDRTLLILEIFERAAQSAEGKLQVGIALLNHKRSRLSGKGVHLAQQRGGIGMRAGPGEKAKAREAQHIHDQILRYKKELAGLEKIRVTQRKRRLDSQIPLIALVGYTNAGKSTILNALTKANVLAEDKPFATLDTTTRSLFINGTQKGLLSDTVGFIQQLPHHLIEAFKSTLSELQFADLLLQVIDLSDRSWKAHIKVVHEILKELEVDKPMLYVFNKADRVADLTAVEPDLCIYNPHVVISANSKSSIKPLTDYLASWQPQEK